MIDLSLSMSSGLEEMRKKLEELAAVGDKDAMFVLSRLKDDSIEFDDDLKMLLSTILEQEGVDKLEQLFGPYIDGIAEDLYLRIKDVPVVLTAMVMSKFIGKLSSNIGPEVGELFVRIMCSVFLAMAMKRNMKLSSLGAFGRFCISTMR
jgi:hypothetical protein